MKMFKNTTFRSGLSLFALLFILGYYFFSFNKHSGWEQKNVIITDSKIYYSYLPATFIYKDLHFNYADSLNNKLGSHQVTGFKNEEGLTCQKMSVGKSIMDIPFFLIAHAWAKMDSNYQANGYDTIYHLLIGLAGLFYGFLALVYVRKILRVQFPDYIVAIVILLIGCSTNLLFYSTYRSGMAHASGLFLVAFFIWNSMRYVDEGDVKALFQAMLALGLAMIVRPTNVLFGLFLLIYLFESGKSLSRLVEDVKNRFAPHLLALLAFLFPIVIQMSLWKYMSGNWIQYSYRDEGFFFSSPEIISGLFSARNGVFLYAPILIFAFVGMFFSFKQKMKLSLIIPLVIFIYVIFSWWTWWYGGSFGSRSFIESYVIMALFLALFFERISSNWHKNIQIIVFSILIILSFQLTKKQSYLSRYGVLHWDSMTYKAYWDLFPTGKYDDSFFDHLEAPDYQNSKKYGEEYIDFKVMDKHNSFSEVVKVSLEDYNVGDSITVVCEIWDSNKIKFDKNTLVYLRLEHEGEVFLYDVKLAPKEKKRTYWNKLILKIPVTEKTQGEIISLQYKYIGDSRCFYRLPKIE